ncbi:hypothetical protein GTP55_10145 [Duganella sp. FT109W]|uniref:FecR protein domain-containing protein n=1 Tax=Duganella margarita TaxID=2692170 RepID=A0ABW9WFB9_9BURK|nr:FecR family protein [Duganella margarita]MYN39733.1 hypothetical protein [Duganella margarita]
MSHTFNRWSLKLAFVLGLVTSAGSTLAAEAGRIVFVAGPVHVGARAVALNDAIQEGDEITTGKQAYVYLRTVDNGLLILRPDSRARIVTYHVDKVDPSKTQIKFELLSGVARSVSGDAVKLARQNFRFNTPVAAIGVRGTDFTVSTDQETSRVTVISGAIVVSGFGGSCAPTGSGPCEHAASRELAANQVGQMLQVKRGQAVPQLLNNSAQSPDVVAPPRSDEPVGKGGGAASSATPGEVSLDPKKGENLLHQAELIKTASLTPPVTTMPPPVSTPETPVTAPDPGVVVTPPVEPVTPSLPAQPAADPSRLIWGRWQIVADQAIQNNNAALAAAGNTEIARNSYYTIFRSPGDVFKSPERGSVAFNLQGGEAMVLNSATKAQSLASIENGLLSVNFDTARFTTGFDLVSDGTRSKLQAGGGVTSDGLLMGDLLYYTSANMTVRGGLSNEKGGSAAYIFTSRLDDKRVVNGVTYWTK